MAIDCFIKIGDIKGETKDSAHLDEIDVLGWNWGFGYDTYAGAGERRTGGMRMREFVFRKSSDIASAELYGAVIMNKTFDVQLTMRKSGTKPLDYIIIKFKNASIRNVEIATEGPKEGPMERVTMSFTEMEYQYAEQDSSGGAGGGPYFITWVLPESV